VLGSGRSRRPPRQRLGNKRARGWPGASADGRGGVPLGAGAQRQERAQQPRRQDKPRRRPVPALPGSGGSSGARASGRALACAAVPGPAPAAAGAAQEPLRASAGRHWRPHHAGAGAEPAARAAPQRPARQGPAAGCWRGGVLRPAAGRVCAHRRHLPGLPGRRRLPGAAGDGAEASGSRACCWGCRLVL
jgi:hypothetical protein